MSGQPEIRVGTGSEGGHWYVPTAPAQCAYEILGKNGKWRQTNMRDARDYGWFPGVTTITRIEANPGLERWKVRQGILAALTHPDALKTADIDKLMAMLETDSKEEARLAATRGTEIHAAIEDFFRTGNISTSYAEYVHGVRAELERLTGFDVPHYWRTEEAATHQTGFGTRVDLYSPEFGFVIDFKGKEFGPDDEIRGYPEQCRQLAACRRLVLPEARCVNLFVSRNNPGLVRSVEWTAKELTKGWDEFIALLRFWQIKNDFPRLA